MGIPLPPDWDEKVKQINKAVNEMAGSTDYSKLKLKNFKIEIDVDEVLKERQLNE